MTKQVLLQGLGAGALVSALAVLGGCSSSHDPFARIDATYQGMVDSICRSCPAAAGATTEAECRTMAAANNPFEGAEYDCQRRVYGMYTTELTPYYDCVASSVATFDGCMRNATRTCPPASSDVSACSDQLDANVQACPRPDSIAATQALSACFQSMP